MRPVSPLAREQACLSSIEPAFHNRSYANYHCRTPVEMSPASPFQMSPSTDCVEELVADDGDSDEPEGDRPDARFA
jgi:hypothetical protein